MDFLYHNVPELKQALQENFLSSPGTAPLFPEYAGGRAPLPSGEEDVAERFAGNALLSVNGVLTLICFFIPFLFYRPHAGNRYAVLIAEMVVPVSLYFVLGTQMFYFKLSNEFLIIKNHFFPWYARGYKLDTIKDIVFESPYKRSNALRVTTKDFASKTFSAGSLRKDTWKDLGKRLEEDGIPVKNEL